MKPFYFKIEQNVQVMVIPDAAAHVDGHPVLTYSYTLYEVPSGSPHPGSAYADALLTPDKRKNRNYFGTLVFDQTNGIYEYVCDGINELSGDQVQEIIQRITHYRENPTLWRI